MIKNILIAVLALAVVLFIALASDLLLDLEPQAAVTTPPVESAKGYLRPVREGNCWRQYIGQGDRDSILVCG
jgi:hypothetical protein